MAPEKLVSDYIENATTTKRHFHVDNNSKFALKLGAFSQDIMQNLTLHNMD